MRPGICGAKHMLGFVVCREDLAEKVKELICSQGEQVILQSICYQSYLGAQATAPGSSP